MQPQDKRKTSNLKERLKTTLVVTIIVVILFYFGIKTDYLIIGLIIFMSGVFTYFTLDYDNDIDDIKKDIEEIKNKIK
ncbi:MAG: hypothetical protein A3J93_04540 [Candidatus Magasanikbacteria bacterium RIFOXYC2_FULL_42_28]|uniref:Uncharacterized protein n=1 Tax=Candidatus Magasanikbacteria bacterium RIFOXYC2_FULL_42_28 TaxID=1798704 RepID=A0A1F6NXP8_9BACT|nr:MAG: hypothetical protein A3J93_04540 [Candidatus Magasanikbacteria bacterium RIFOXYC2_FULL_42_28]